MRILRLVGVFGLVSLGHRMLLLGAVDHEKLYSAGSGFTQQPFDAEVAVMDLATGKHRTIGRAAGTWTQATALPHPRLEVAWNDGTVDPHAVRFSDDAVTLVDPATETLR
jgi:hypothetical protein